MNSVDIDASCVANSNECNLGDIAEQTINCCAVCIYLSLLAAMFQCNNVFVY